MNPWVLHQNEEIFGPEPESFRPERWLQNETVVSVMERNFLTVRHQNTHLFQTKDASTD